MELIVLVLLVIGIIVVVLINRCSKLESRVDILEDILVGLSQILPGTED